MQGLPRIIHAFRRHPRIYGVCLATAAGILLLWGAVELLTRHAVLPLESVEYWKPSTLYYDRAGNLFHVQRGTDSRWNFPIPYAEIPPELIRYVLATEDRNFWNHDGFDAWASLRAVKQLLVNHRILSGASTVTMQTMTMFTGRQRTLRYKLRQIFLARNWERTHSKQEILEFYFNHLPYGGSIYGIEAAAQYYFGRHVRELNRSELVLLAGLPQAPSRYRPDRHPVRAIQRRDVVLHLLLRNGAMTEAEAEEIRREPLRYRRFEIPFWPQETDTHYMTMALQETSERHACHLALDTRLQAILRNNLLLGQATLHNVKDGAGVIVENATGKVRAMVGTLNFLAPVDGAVNAADAWRSPGSALKPFLYGEAIFRGMITAETRLQDEKLLLKDYRPGNFDGNYRGDVSAAEALADSLNTPAVRLLQRLGVPSLLQKFSGMGLIRPELAFSPDKIGLSLAIGGTESTLLKMAAAYSALAGGPGILLWQEDDSPPTPVDSPYWNEGTRALLLKMLRFRPMPGAGGLPVAWKTGTSNGNRDAWCFAVTPHWTVGIWYGNKNGTASPALVGATAAAPVAGAIHQALARETPPIWDESPEILNARLCAKTGLAPSSACKKCLPGSRIAGIPLRTCTACKEGALLSENSQTKILSPQPGDYLADPSDGLLRISLETLPARGHLYIDGEYRGIHISGEKISLCPGSHRISLWGGDGWSSASLDLNVLQPPAGKR